MASGGDAPDEVRLVDARASPGEAKVTPVQTKLAAAKGKVTPVQTKPAAAEGKVTPVQAKPAAVEGKDTPVQTKLAAVYGKDTLVQAKLATGRSSPAKERLSSPIVGEKVSSPKRGWSDSSGPDVLATEPKRTR